MGAESVISAWKNIWNINQSHKLCAVRAGNVVGGGDMSKDRLVPDIIRSVVAKNIVSIRNPKSRRPWQHVLDPLIGYVYSANGLLNGKDFESINFGPTEQSLSVNDVLDIAKKELGKDFKYEILHYIKSNMELESNYLDLNSDFATKNLNWSPKWNQEEALTRTFSWWKSIISNEMSADEACGIDIKDFLKNDSGL